MPERHEMGNSALFDRFQQVRVNLEGGSLAKHTDLEHEPGRLIATNYHALQLPERSGGDAATLANRSEGVRIQLGLAGKCPLDRLIKGNPPVETNK